MKLTEGWGEAKNYSKGVDDSTCFQNGGLSDRETSIHFVKNACSAG